MMIIPPMFETVEQLRDYELRNINLDKEMHRIACEHKAHLDWLEHMKLFKVRLGKPKKTIANKQRRRRWNK